MALHLPLLLLPRSKEQPSSKSSPLQFFPVLQPVAYPHRMTCQSNSTLHETSSSPARRTANFQPTIWDDNYIQSLPTGFMEEKHENRREQLKEDVRCLIGKQNGLIDQLELVDSLNQLGISYHFDSEIKCLLNSISSSVENMNGMIQNKDLHGVALMFRLFREYCVHEPALSAEVMLSCFRNERGSSKPNCCHYIKGILSLYEASFLAMEGEDELEEAGEFATEFLRNLRRPLLDEQLVEKIDHALELPLHWRMPRLHSRWFIDVYEKLEKMNPTLLEFAKLDFNKVQGVYKEELKEMSTWWRNVGLVCDELGFARDRLVEHYLWSIGYVFRPEFGRCRKTMTKFNCFVTTIDDIYDVYGTMDELEHFTKALQQWEMTEGEELPEYMKICLNALFNTVDDIANMSLTEKGLDILPCLKRMWEDLTRAHLVEARWYHTEYTPTLDEYLENAWLSISGHCGLTAATCLSDELTPEALNSLEFYPSVVRTSCTIFRLYDDLGTSTDEVQRGDVPKSIQCYMKEKNVSELEARDHIKRLIRRYWKELNGGRITATKYIKSFQEALVDILRMAQCFYQYGDGHGKPNQETRNRVIMLLIEPIKL